MGTPKLPARADLAVFLGKNSLSAGTPGLTGLAAPPSDAPIAALPALGAAATWLFPPGPPFSCLTFPGAALPGCCTVRSGVLWETGLGDSEGSECRGSWFSIVVVADERVCCAAFYRT